jgi:hypothetical protein
VYRYTEEKAEREAREAQPDSSGQIPGASFVQQGAGGKRGAGAAASSSSRLSTSSVSTRGGGGCIYKLKSSCDP